MLLDPVLNEKYDFVSSRYLRHHHTATITNHFAYPIMSAIYGKMVRQPIGGEFSFSEDMIKAYLKDADVWTSDVGTYGVDNWLTSTAIINAAAMCEVDLGVKKHNFSYFDKRSAMFKQVAKTIFAEVRQNIRYWREIGSVRSSVIVGPVLNLAPAVVRHDFRDWIRSAKKSYQDCRRICARFLSPAMNESLKHLFNAKDEEFEFTSERWADCVYEFMKTYLLTGIGAEETFWEALSALWQARVGTFMKKTSLDLSANEAERILQDQLGIFAAKKPDFVGALKAALKRKGKAPPKVELIHPLLHAKAKVFVFDWDGTVIRSFPDWKEIIKRALSELFLDSGLSAEGLPYHFGSVGVIHWSVREAKRRGGIVRSESYYAAKYVQAINKFFDGLRNSERILPGANEFLMRLSGQGHKLFVLTAAYKSEKTLQAKALGMDGMFEEIIGKRHFSESPFQLEQFRDTLVFKREQLRRIKKEQGLSRHEIAMFGDSPFDVLAAKEAGVIAVGIAKDEETREVLIRAGADVIINGDYEGVDLLPVLSNGATIRTNRSEIRATAGRLKGVWSDRFQEALRAQDVGRLISLAGDDYYWMRIAALSRLAKLAEQNSESVFGALEGGDAVLEELATILKAYRDVGQSDIIEKIRTTAAELEAQGAQPVEQNVMRYVREKETLLGYRYATIARWGGAPVVKVTGPLLEAKRARNGRRKVRSIVIWQMIADMALFNERVTRMPEGAIVQAATDYLFDLALAKQASVRPPEDVADPEKAENAWLAFAKEVSKSFNQGAPGLRTGAVVVLANGEVGGLGCNGPPLGQMSDAAVTGVDIRQDDFLQNNKAYTARHRDGQYGLDIRDNRTDLRRSICAEQRAVMAAIYSGKDLRGATLYSTNSLCRQCFLTAFNAGIRRFRFSEDFHDQDTELMLKEVSGSVDWKWVRTEKSTAPKPVASQGPGAPSLFSVEGIRAKADEIAEEIRKATDEKDAPQDRKRALETFRAFLAGASGKDIQTLRNAALSLQEDHDVAVNAYATGAPDLRLFYPQLIGMIDAKAERLDEETPRHLRVDKSMLEHSYAPEDLPKVYKLGERLVRYVNSRQIYDVSKRKWVDLQNESDLLDKENGPFDVMMVFGSGYVDVPKEAARIALELREQYPDQNPAMEVIIVGNHGTARQMALDSDVPEAKEFQADMKNERVIVPDKFLGLESTNTKENVIEAHKVADRLGLHPKRIIIVSALSRRAGPTFTLHYPGQYWSIWNRKITHPVIVNAVEIIQKLLNGLFGKLYGWLKWRWLQGRKFNWLHSFYPNENEILGRLSVEKVAIWTPKIVLKKWAREKERLAVIRDAVEEIKKMSDYSKGAEPWITPTPIPDEILKIAHELRLLADRGMDETNGGVRGVGKNTGGAASDTKQEVRTIRSELRVAAIGKSAVSEDRADRMVRSIRQNTQPATVFVDAEDFQNLSLAQKQEYLIVALSNKALRVVVYNQHGEAKDKLLVALLKLDRVTRTSKDLDGAQRSFSRSNVPGIHVSKQILPSQELVQRLRERVSFFKAKGETGGTLAAALLWAWSGGEDARLREISQGRDGFWIVAETLVSALQRSYDTTLAFAVAA